MYSDFTVLDVETTFQTDEDGNTDPMPYDPRNYLVSIGLKSEDWEDYHCVRHTKKKGTNNFREMTQLRLDSTKLLIAHNMKFDLSWIRECDFIYDGPVWDTMICEFVLSKSLKRPLDLSSCCQRYGIETKKSDLTDFYLKKGIGFEAMPWDVVEEYGRQDITITWYLFKQQYELLRGEVL